MARATRMAALATAVMLLFGGLALAQRDYDDDDGYSRGGGAQARQYGYQSGYRDGSTVARQDRGRGKRFNPNPRGPYDDKDHGYRSDYGDKNAYKAQYTNGYRAGYEAKYNRGYSGY